MTIADELAEIPLVDQHCHPVVLDAPDRAHFELMLSEARDPRPEGVTEFDTQVGLAVRRWSAPALGLQPHAEPDEYLARRSSLGPEESTRLLLRACGASDLLVDTGLSMAGMCSLDELRRISGARVHEVVRMETVAETMAAGGVGADEFGAALTAELGRRAEGAVGFKTVAAYRVGLELPAIEPDASDVRRAAGRWLARCERTGRHRLDDPVLVAHAVWSCLQFGLPVQVHAGFGDPDLTLQRADPSLLTPFLRALPAHAPPIVLLHCYPYHRQAASLAAVFPNVALDLSLAVNHVGPRAAAVVAETLELTPFGSLLYGSDGIGLAELHHLGAVLFRRALGQVLEAWVADDVLTAVDASRYARMIAGDNARRLYPLASQPETPG